MRGWCVVVCMGALFGCSTEQASQPCVVGEARSCSCGFSPGSQRCLEDGVGFSACECGPGVVPAGGSSGGSGAGGVAGVAGAGGSAGSGGAAGGEPPPDGGAPVIEPGPGTVIAEPADAAAFLWDDQTLRTFELELSQANLDTIDNNPAAEQYVEATLKFEDALFSPVGLRYKGSVGAFLGCTAGGGFQPSGPKTCPKLSMKVSLNWMNPEGRFYGLKKLQFHSMNNDDSLLRERLGYALFREMGIAGPRAQHVRLVINGQFAGLFLLVEEIDGRFTKSRFTDGGDGNLYKEIWPVWTDATAYHPPALHTNEDSPTLSYDRVLRFATALEAAADTDAARGLVGEWMDLDYALGFIAVDRTIVHDDGMFHWYCGAGGGGATGNNPGTCSNHNYYWYEGQSADRLWLVPWDLDLSLGGDTTGITPITTAWDNPNVNCMLLLGQMPPSCDKLTRTWASFQMRYKGHVRRLLDGPFAAANVDAKLDAWSAQITAVVQEASQIGHQPAPQAWNTAVGSLRSFVNSRRQAMNAIASP